MDINRENLDSLFRAFSLRYQQGLEMAIGQVEQLATLVPSTTAKNTYGFLALLSSIREWIGPRHIQNIENKTTDVPNRDFEHTIGVPRNDIEDDNLGIYNPLFQQMGQDAGGLWWDLAIEALTTNSNWLDGAPFFGTTRTYSDGNTIVNTTANALSDAEFNTAYQTMMSHVGYNGRALRVMPSLLVVGPALRQTAWNILKNKFAYDATDKVQIDNINQNVADLLVVPELVGTYANYWFLLDVRKVIKPVVVQQRKMPSVVRWDNDTDQNVKEQNRNDYGVHARGAGVLTLPHLAYAGIL